MSFGCLFHQASLLPGRGLHGLSAPAQHRINLFSQRQKVLNEPN